MARKPSRPFITLQSPLSPGWRDHVRDWRITAMMGKIPQEEYLAEVRAFENHHIAAGTLSADWAVEWKAWCKERLIAQVRKHLDPSVLDDPPETLGLFSSL